MNVSGSKLVNLLAKFWDHHSSDGKARFFLLADTVILCKVEKKILKLFYILSADSIYYLFC